MLFLPSRRGIPPYVGRHPLWQIAGQVPAFHLDFTTGQAIERIGGRMGTFTRPSSVKSVWNGSQFVEVAADVPALQRDPETGLWGYLHESAATNLYLNSAAPATQTISVAAVQHTLSFYGTGTLTLSGVSTAGPLVGTGAEPNRVSLTFTPTAGNLTLTLSGSISRPQLETGPIATSPIITTGSAVTRAVDTWTWTGAQFSDWYQQAGGVFVFRGIYLRQIGFPGFVSWSDGTNSNRIQLAGVGLNRRAVVTSGGAAQYDSPAASLGANVIGQPFALAMRATAANFVSAANGGNTHQQLSGSVPSTLNQLRLGADGAGANVADTLIRDVLYFPPGPAADRIQALSAL
jgi:hypothetical protein